MKQIGFTITLFILLLAGCAADTSTPSEGKAADALKIYATLYPLAYFAEQIGEEYVDVETILPPGSDPHNFEPTSKMMVDIAEADIFLFNGANLEGYAGAIEDSLANEEVYMLEAAKGISLVDHVHDHGEEGHSHDDHDHGEEGHSHDDHDHGEEGHSHDDHDHGEEGHSHDDHDHGEEGHNHDDHDHGEEGHNHDDHDHGEEGHNHDDHDHGEEGHSHDDHDHEGHAHGDEDPHVWLDPIRSIELARHIKDTLVDLKPEQEELFEANFTDLESRLTDLDEAFHAKLEGTSQHEILVTHAAYGYWEQYGIEQIAITGVSSTEEPSQKKLEEIIDRTKEAGIKTLLFEQNIEPKVAEVIQSETNVDSLQLHNLSVLTDEDINNNETYFTLMEKNLEVLEQALNY
ncbi:metal ABC transporter solute-binding protein, Zn/Mn family [Gracilibacillus alcaliphilus]|uniref:metal ABC transporter solute-binding protein, Zn/Mn family n=1 Tax=Gracilibacillus alcaliphilus TaxID=1401441 RepID=UPI001957E5B3|nr:zinc transport system substrate-binding protein [Gracilibacillus alcaliphilus]